MVAYIVATLINPSFEFRRVSHNHHRYGLNLLWSLPACSESFERTHLPLLTFPWFSGTVRSSTAFQRTLRSCLGLFHESSTGTYVSVDNLAFFSIFCFQYILRSFVAFCGKREAIYWGSNMWLQEFLEVGKLRDFQNICCINFRWKLTPKSQPVGGSAFEVSDDKFRQLRVDVLINATLSSPTK